MDCATPGCENSFARIVIFRPWGFYGQVPSLCPTCRAKRKKNAGQAKAPCLRDLERHAFPLHLSYKGA